MVYASPGFHTAITNGNKQIIYCNFGDFLLDETDVSSSGGLSVQEYLNPNDDYTIGSSGSSSFSLNIINKTGLDQYRFGEFQAYIGAQTETLVSFAETTGKLFLQYDEETYIEAFESSPYLKKNGVALSVQPTNPIVALFCYNDSLYAIEDGGNATKYNMPSGTVVSDYQPSDFMKDKFAQMNDQSIAYTKAGTLWNELKTQSWQTVASGVWGSYAPVFARFDFTVNDGVVYRDMYELCSVGVFIPDSPYITNDVLLRLSGQDRNGKIDVIATDVWNGMQFPTSFVEIVDKMCEFAGIRCVRYPQMTDAARAFRVLHVDLKNMTARQILEQIAQATGTFVRFNRDGDLEFCNFIQNNLKIDWNFGLTIANYSVHSITQVDSPYASSKTLPGEANVYVINKDLFGLSSDILDGILAYVNEFYVDYEYSPTVASICGDPSICAGDVLLVKTEEEDEGVLVPAFSNTFTWNAEGKTVIESTGSEYRGVGTNVNRELQTCSNNIVELKGTTNGIKQAIENEKLVFDKNGLTIYGNGMHIVDDAGNVVFTADENGEVYAVGSFQSGDGNNRVRMNNRGIILGDESDPNGRIWNLGSMTIASFDQLNSNTEEFTTQIYGGQILTTEKETVENETELIDRFGVSCGVGSENDELFLHNPATGTGTNAVFVTVGNDYYLRRSSSSIRYKKDIQELTDDAEKIIDSLKPITYRDKDSDSENRFLGFLAEDVDKVCKKLVFYADVNGEKVPDSLAYDRINVLLVKDNQRMHQEIKELKDQIEELLERIKKNEQDT